MSRAADIARAKADIDAVYADGFAEGKQAEYDAFWDVFQSYGKQTSYNYAFYGSRWNEKTFYPKYDIKPSWSIVGAFQYCAVKDLEARLNECGVVLDTSDNANYSGVFQYSGSTVLPEIVFSGFATVTANTFGQCTSLHTIRKIKLQEGFNAAMLYTFSGCSALENVVFEGVIPQSISIGGSPELSKASITSIMNALSTTATEQTATFSKTAVNNAFGGSTSAEWLALVATRSNWTIALA